MSLCTMSFSAAPCARCSCLSRCAIARHCTTRKHTHTHTHTHKHTRSHTHKHTHAHVLLSILTPPSSLIVQGIYYQAEIMGQTITWIAPYKFSTEVRLCLLLSQQLTSLSCGSLCLPLPPFFVLFVCSCVSWFFFSRLRPTLTCES